MAVHNFKKPGRMRLYRERSIFSWIPLRTIRLYDKLLLVLSEHSIASSWVAYEVKKVLDKEPLGVPNVLYPIRLDNAMMHCQQSWVQDICNTRQIGDFTRWKEHDAYQNAFQQLLHALEPKS